MKKAVRFLLKICACSTVLVTVMVAFPVAVY